MLKTATVLDICASKLLVIVYHLYGVKIVQPMEYSIEYRYTLWYNKPNLRVQIKYFCVGDGCLKCDIYTYYTSILG